MPSNALTSPRTAGRHFPGPGSVSTLEDASFTEAPPSDRSAGDCGGEDREAIATIGGLTGHELGLAVASEVMGWRLVPGGFGEIWIDAEGNLTGYYNGRPFSPYRDRNALASVWERVASLGLTAAYIRFLSILIDDQQDERGADPWTMHCCDPDLACRAALLAVRITS